MPPIIFFAKIVTTLRLAGCKLEQSSHAVGFCSVKTLTLDNVHLDDPVIDKLTSECPLIEALYLNSCVGMKRICITKPRKIKITHIHVPLAVDIVGVTIAIPSLQLFMLNFETRLRSLCEVDLAGCPCLTNLKLVGDIVHEKEFHYLISTLPSLNTLTVEWCRWLQRLVISSNRLIDLWIANCANLRAIDIDIPNLRNFSYLINPIPLCSMKAPCPWTIVLAYRGFDPQWYNNVKEFLNTTTKQCELTIFLDSARNAFHLEKFPERPRRISRHVEHFTMLTRTIPSNLADLLNGIFLVCYPKLLTLHTGKLHRRKMIKFLLDELKNDDVCCCYYEDIKCWQHYLQGFALESPLAQNGNELEDVDSFAEELSTNPNIQLQFRLDWSLPSVDDLVDDVFD